MNTIKNTLSELFGDISNEKSDVMTFAALESTIGEIDSIINESAKGQSQILTFAAFESFLDDAIKEIAPATEGTDTITEKLIATAKKNIDEKCTTLEACNKMLATIAAEAVNFNSCMANMADAGKALRAGSIDKATFKERITPSITGIKAACSIVGSVDPSYAYESTFDDKYIKAVRDFMIATEGLLNEKKNSFAGDPALEDFIASCEEMTITTEGALTYSVRLMFSEKKRDAIEAIKAAKKDYKAKDYVGAVAKYNKAKALFTQLKNKLKDIPETEFAHVTGKEGGKDTDLKSTANMFISKSVADGYFTNKITACDEAIFKIENAKKKAGRKATESTGLFAFIDDIATESEDPELPGDDDDDGADLDESSFDSFLK